MTLIISEVSKWGIAMAADSAITTQYPSSLALPSGQPVPATVRTGVKKITPINSLNSAISVWGRATVGTESNPDKQIPIDRFLQDFASTVDSGTSLEAVGAELASLINARVRVGEVRGGFHLAGYANETDSDSL